MTTERELRRIFRSVVLGLSAGAVAGVACSPTTDNNDAGPDAVADVSDSGNAFPETSLVDSYVVWCDAGPPEFITIVPASCNDMLYVPCGLPADDYIKDAALQPNQMNRCDQVCKGWEQNSCEVMTYGQVALIFAVLDGGWDAAIGDAEVADAGVADANDPDAIPPLNSPLYVSCDCTGGGRRPTGLYARRRGCSSPLGEYFASMAHLEAASVPAFLRMHAELAALGAPRSLLRRIARSVRDEQRHARVVGKLARGFGGIVESPRVRRHRARHVEAIARENVIEGCVRETYGALVATWQAQSAGDPRVRRAMATIAIDETRHAAVSMAAEAFLAEKLDARARGRVERARQKAVIDLRAAVTHAPHPDLVRVAGVPSTTQSQRLLDALASALWTRSFFAATCP